MARTNTSPVRTFPFLFDAVFDSVLAVLPRLPSTLDHLDFLLPALTSSIEHNFAHLRTTQAPA